MCLYVSPTFLRGVRTGEGSGFPGVLTPLMDLRRRVVNFQLVQLCLVVTMERQLLSSLHASLKLPHYYIKPDSKQSCPLLETVGGGCGTLPLSSRIVYSTNVFEKTVWIKSYQCLFTRSTETGKTHGESSPKNISSFPHGLVFWQIFP